MAAFWRVIKTPVGPVRLAVDADELITVDFVALHHEPPVGREDRRLLPEAAAWLRSCLKEPVGAPPIPLPHTSPFRAACWSACRDIPLGQTRTYTELAAMAGNPKAARAAGSAMRENPMSLLTPCHRVVGASGMGGYAGTVRGETPNLRLKGHILEIERRIAEGVRYRPGNARQRVDAGL